MTYMWLRSNIRMTLNNPLWYIYSQCQAMDEWDVKGIKVEEVVEIRPHNGEITRPTVLVMGLELTHDWRIIIIMVHGMGDIVFVKCPGIHPCTDQHLRWHHWLAHLKFGVSISPYTLCWFIGCCLTLWFCCFLCWFLGFCLTPSLFLWGDSSLFLWGLPAVTSFFTGSGVGVHGRFSWPVAEGHPEDDATDRPMGGMRIAVFFYLIQVLRASPKVKISASIIRMSRATDSAFWWTWSIFTTTYPSCTGTVWQSFS